MEGPSAEHVSFVGQLVDEFRHLVPEMVGGFVGYFFHEIQHTFFRRPGKALLGLFRRRR